MDLGQKSQVIILYNIFEIWKYFFNYILDIVIHDSLFIYA